MKQVIFSGLLLFSTISNAELNIQPYSVSTNTYMVDGKGLKTADAVKAYLNGKPVLECKSQKSDKVFMVNGKIVAGGVVNKCTPKCLAETKTGYGFKTCVK